MKKYVKLYEEYDGHIEDDVIIKDITVDHKEEVVAILKREREEFKSYDKEGNFPEINMTAESWFDSYFEEESIFIGMFLDDKIVSIASGYTKNDNTILVLDNLYTLPEFRHLGYSKKLTDERIKRGKLLGANYCELEVLATNPAKDLFEKQGFEVYGYSMIKEI